MLGAEGLVGQIIETGALSARVLLIDDLAHSTPVVVLRNGLRALAHGQGPGALSLPYLSSQDDIRLGDLLVTSGLGGRFPPGYPVARVLSVEGFTSDAFLTVRAEPLAPLRRLQDVVVLSVAGGKRPPWDRPLAPGAPGARIMRSPGPSSLFGSPLGWLWSLRRWPYPPWRLRPLGSGSAPNGPCSCCCFGS